MNSSTNDAQPMDIGATYKGKGKYNNKGKGKYNKGKGKTQWHNKGKGYTGYSQQGYKGKGPTPIGHGNPFKGAMQYKGKSKGKGPPQWQSTTMNKAKEKEHVTNVVNRATMQGTAEWQSTTSQTWMEVQTSTTNNSHTINNHGQNKSSGTTRNNGSQITNSGNMTSNSKRHTTRNNSHHRCLQHQRR
jgi:hypothetical protein